MPTEKTVPKQLTPWEPGQSGNPAGRPKGSRNKLGEAFIEALHADFEVHGTVAIEACRKEKPDAYLKVLASILPKELKISNESDLTDEQLIERIRQLDSVIRPFLGVEGEGGASSGSHGQACQRRHVAADRSRELPDAAIEFTMRRLRTAN